MIATRKRDETVLKKLIGLSALAGICVGAFGIAATVAAEQGGDTQAAAAGKASTNVASLAERLKSAGKGELKNPYTDSPEAIAAGRKLYLSYSCNGCHGGGGGGGICPPLTNAVWVYGSEDDTLFRLVSLGSQDLQKEGYTRKGRESVQAPMPPYVDIIKSDDELWKIIAFIRSVYRDDPKYRNW